MSNLPAQPNAPQPDDASITGDSRSASDRATDETVAALFRDSGLALSNGHAPALQGSDARARAAEEVAISALFLTADRLQTAPGPDFRRMAAKAREIAGQRTANSRDDEVVGEITRSDLKQLPDLEVRCWNVSQTASLPVETSATPEAPAVLAPEIAARPARASARATVPLTAHDAANIREQNWTEFKHRYHAERRVRVLEMAAAGALGAAACFLLVWAGGLIGNAGTVAPGSAENPRELAGNPAGSGLDRPFAGAPSVRDVRHPALPESDAGDNEIIPVEHDSMVGDKEWAWIEKNRTALDLPTPSDKMLINGPTFFVPKVEPNPRRKLGELFPPRVAGDNAWPELFAERNQGLRIIRLNPHSDCAQALLAVNDWIVRVIKADGATLDLSQGDDAALQAWRGFLATQKAGDEFDVEYVRGPLIRRTTVSLASDAPAAATTK